MAQADSLGSQFLPQLGPSTMARKCTLSKTTSEGGRLGQLLEGRLELERQVKEVRWGATEGV